MNERTTLAAVALLRKNIYVTIREGILRPFSGPTAGAPWQPANAVVRFTDQPAKLLERLVNMYLFNPYRGGSNASAGDSSSSSYSSSSSSSTCALDRKQWARVDVHFTHIQASTRSRIYSLTSTDV